MPTPTGQIVTLYEDAAQTKAIYPRTKITAVSDENGNTLGNVAMFNSEFIGDVEDHSIVVPKLSNVLSGTSEPSSSIGNDGDIYIVIS